MPLKGVLDIDGERDRLQKKIEQKENYVAGLLRKLSEPNFLERAPAPVVAREKARCRETRRGNRQAAREPGGTGKGIAPNVYHQGTNTKSGSVGNISGLQFGAWCLDVAKRR